MVTDNSVLGNKYSFNSVLDKGIVEMVGCYERDQCFLPSSCRDLCFLPSSLLNKYHSSLLLNKYPSSLPSIKNIIFFLSAFFSSMDSNSYKQISNFVDLLNSQQDTVFGYVQDNVEVSSSQIPFFTSRAKEEDSPAERGERMTWTPVDDIALISAWLNTSKDPIVGNEQRAGAF